MRKKHVLLIGILILMVFCGIPKKVNAETEEVNTLEGNITYDKDYSVYRKESIFFINNRISRYGRVDKHLKKRDGKNE